MMAIGKLPKKTVIVVEAKRLFDDYCDTFFVDVAKYDGTTHHLHGVYNSTSHKDVMIESWKLAKQLNCSIKTFGCKL